MSPGGSRSTEGGALNLAAQGPSGRADAASGQPITAPPGPLPSGHLILTGFMGTGKTVVGQLIARRLGREFVDMDALIEAREGLAVSEIFAQRGEAHFRRLEATLCRELAARSGSRVEPAPGLVIATGGGTLLSDANRDILSASGPIFCLTASPDEIAARLEAAAGRPLLDISGRRERIASLLAERAAAYRLIPVHLDTTGLTVEQVADRALALIRPPLPVTIVVRHDRGEYNIHLGRGLLAQCGELLKSHGLGPQVVVVTNPVVGRLYGASTAAGLEEAGFEVSHCSISDGEAVKTLDTVRTLYDGFISAGVDRQGAVLALGGGVIGDIAGFAAATYLRGVALVQLPTTLLAMVDSSVGGKVAVDHPRGKNLIGAFKQPALVIADSDTSSTLSVAMFADGLAEVVKAGLIGDPLLFEQIEAYGPAPLPWLVERAIRVKLAIVENDPYERGQQAVLNLGHTFGHALEWLSGYSLTHGQAVSIGLVAAAWLSARLGLCDPAFPARLERVLERLGLPAAFRGHTPEAVWSAMSTDRERRGGRLRLVLFRGLGEPVVTDAADQGDVTAVLETMTKE